MIFVSYAGNCEDVLLWRALGTVSGGFYVDAGAVHPDQDSVTRAFYERGWRGLNVVPAALAARFATTRLRDVTVATDSTRDLAAVLDAHVDGPIHFLRLDAASAMDFTRHRPWIVLVHAVSSTEAGPFHPDLKRALVDGGYVFAWFDGVSHFYLAEERAADLAQHFATPPNTTDGFVRAVDSALAPRLAAAEAKASVLADRLRAAEAAAREDMRATMEMRVLNEHRIQQIRSIEAVVTRERSRADTAETWLHSIQRSSSWRATAPLRRALATLRRQSAVPPPVPEQPTVGQPPVDAVLFTPPSAPLPPQAAIPVFRRAVHQYHPGTARGDAVTNSMLLIRGILRGLGYASDIYCDQPDPGIDAELRAAEELPRHDGYVLLVHVSLGYPAFDAIADLPAGKVLMYHNITPAEFLTGNPALQEFVHLGHRQLPLWKPLVAAALAVSDINALDLRGHGFPEVQTCPLLFDVEAMRARAGVLALPRTDERFTILFVGRIVESKAQDDLVEAYAAFRLRFDRPSRLVLVGRSHAPGDAFIRRLQARITTLELDAHVDFPGFVDDHALHQCYREADLYVSLSYHEGFGVPLVEAMAHGVPVLAWPCGAVPGTLDDPQSLLDDRSPEAVAARMLALAKDPECRLATLRRQSRGLDRFRLDRHIPHLLQALARAGAVLPPGADTRRTLDATLCFTVSGHINGSYSLAAVNRGLARSIEAVMPGRARIVPVEGQETADLSGVPSGEAEGIAQLVSRAKPAAGPEVVISQHYPVHVPQHRGDALVALFYWEESLIPVETVRGLNRDFRAVLAPSAFVAKTLVDSGVAIPVHRVGQAPDLAAFRRIGAARSHIPRAVTTFLHVSSCLPRKGVDLLLQAFARAFGREDAVRLVIKGYPNPHNEVAAQLDAIRAAFPDIAEITFINGDLDAEAFLDLYRNADVMVLPTRGEGFNLPAAEAMAAGLPLIVTGFGGHADFCTPRTARLVAARFAPSGSHLATGGSVWVEPDIDDLVVALREAVRNPDAARARLPEAAAMIADTMSDGGLVGRLRHAALDVLITPPPAPARMAWITTWHVRCGVADYSAHLLAAWPADGAFAATTVLADARTELPPGRSAAMSGSGPRIRVAWRLGDPAIADDLAGAVAQEDPDIVVIQHQPGLIPFAALARLLTSHALARRVVAVTLHNTGHLAQIPAAECAETVAALAGVDRVIVHGIADLERLRTLGLQGNVVMMPHGVPAGRPAVAPRALPSDAVPVLGCYGFFLPGKGIAQLITALPALRGTWPSLRLRLVCAAYGTPDSDAEIAACRAVADTLGLGAAIDWHTDFLPDARSADLLAGCDLVVLPYQASREASSAALRSVLAAGVPVAVTPLAVFDDAEEAVTRLSGTDPAALAEGIATLLRDTALRVSSLARAQNWMVSHAWPSIAERMAGLLRGLVQRRRIDAEASHPHQTGLCRRPEAGKEPRSAGYQDAKRNIHKFSIVFWKRTASVRPPQPYWLQRRKVATTGYAGL